jgi:UDP-N-acetylglucosamine 2-epimerase (non-hydrolysing)
MKTILFVFGTRPEAIKMAPLIKAFSRDKSFEVKIAVTAQHREMLDQVLDFFSITPDYDLNLMRPNQTLFHITADVLLQIQDIYVDAKPDMVFVQGDTTTVFAGALAAFYKKIKIAHVEAGLRSHNKYSPFPEEMNRLLTSRLADIHLAPTPTAADNLRKEGINENIYMTGNTVIDALFLGLDMLKDNEEKYKDFFENIDFSKKIILVTCHRRENFGAPFRDICQALLDIAEAHKEVQIIYPVHLNPNIKEVAHALLLHPRIKLIAPLEYPYLLWLMDKSYLILTDSGGIQEEGPSLGKPILVLREVTERQEGIDAGTAILVGTDRENIFSNAHRLLIDDKAYESMAKAVNPYGDGTSATQTVEIVKTWFLE